MKRVMCFSSCSTNLRYQAWVRIMREQGIEVIVPKPHRSPGSFMELFATILPNCWIALTCRADLAGGCKPHLNVTLPLLIAKLRGIPTWLDVDDLCHAYLTGWMSKLLEIIQKPFPRFYSMVSYHNNNLRSFLVDERGVRPERIFRVEQGVDCTLFNGNADKSQIAAIRSRYALEGKPVAVYTAHLNVASDLEPVMQTWRKVLCDIPDATLLIVGGGPLRQHFEQMAEQYELSRHLHFIGEVRHDEVPSYFAVADVALVYFSERLVNKYRCSLKLREYFAAGVKVVCNDFAEFKDYEHLTYQSDSRIDSFAAMIVSVLRNGGDGRERTAQEYTRKHLHWPLIVESMVAEINRRIQK